jgi:hypothetical protein
MSVETGNGIVQDVKTNRTSEMIDQLLVQQQDAAVKFGHISSFLLDCDLKYCLLRNGKPTVKHSKTWMVCIFGRPVLVRFSWQFRFFI